MDLLLKTLGTIFSFFQTESVSSRENATKYVMEVLRHVKNVIDPQDLSNKDAIDYSHELVKKLHKNASVSIGNVVSQNYLAKVNQALSAARIYYWLRQYKGKPNDEIINLVKDRVKRVQSGQVRHQSNEYITKKIINLDDSHLAEDQIELIHADCFADIAELEELYLSVHNRNRSRKWK